MTRQSNSNRQKKKRRDKTGESKNSPEVPDRGWTSDIPGLPLGALRGKKQS